MPLMGDPLPYGMTANRASIEALMTYALAAEADPGADAASTRSFVASTPEPFASITRKVRHHASIIDIHPHVIATDTALSAATARRHQTTWSRDRPTPYES